MAESLETGPGYLVVEYRSAIVATFAAGMGGEPVITFIDSSIL
jgi:hypothetical protein